IFFCRTSFRKRSESWHSAQISTNPWKPVHVAGTTWTRETSGFSDSHRMQVFTLIPFQLRSRYTLATGRRLRETQPGPAPKIAVRSWGGGGRGRPGPPLRTGYTEAPGAVIPGRLAYQRPPPRPPPPPPP